MIKEKGNEGENTACMLLETLGFTIIDRNFYTRQGEIDIIAQKGTMIHFIEVKTSYGPYNPAENFHATKLARFMRAVRLYCYFHKISDEMIEIDLALVNMKERRFNLVNNANLYFH